MVQRIAHFRKNNWSLCSFMYCWSRARGLLFVFEKYRSVPFSSNADEPTAAAAASNGPPSEVPQSPASSVPAPPATSPCGAQGTRCQRAVLSVPAYWRPAQRAALLSAARVGGIDPLGLLHDTTASAITYACTRLRPTAGVRTPFHLVIADFGAEAFQVIFCGGAMEGAMPVTFARPLQVRHD